MGGKPIMLKFRLSMTSSFEQIFVIFYVPTMVRENIWKFFWHLGSYKRLGTLVLAHILWCLTLISGEFIDRLHKLVLALVKRIFFSIGPLKQVIIVSKGAQRHNYMAEYIHAPKLPCNQSPHCFPPYHFPLCCFSLPALPYLLLSPLSFIWAERPLSAETKGDKGRRREGSSNKGAWEGSGDKGERPYLRWYAHTGAIV